MTIQMIYLGFVIKLSDIRSIFVSCQDHCVHVFGAVCFDLLWRMSSKLLFYLWCPIKVPFTFKKRKSEAVTCPQKLQAWEKIPCLVFVVSGSCPFKNRSRSFMLKRVPLSCKSLTFKIHTLNPMISHVLANLQNSAFGYNVKSDWSIQENQIYYFIVRGVNWLVLSKHISQFL